MRVAEILWRGDGSGSLQVLPRGWEGLEGVPGTEAHAARMPLAWCSRSIQDEGEGAFTRGQGYQ